MKIIRLNEFVGNELPPITIMLALMKIPIKMFKCQIFFQQNHLIQDKSPVNYFQPSMYISQHEMD